MNRPVRPLGAPVEPCGHRDRDWVCITRPHPAFPDNHFYVRTEQ